MAGIFAAVLPSAPYQPLYDFDPASPAYFRRNAPSHSSTTSAPGDAGQQALQIAQHQAHRHGGEIAREVADVEGVVAQCRVPDRAAIINKGGAPNERRLRLLPADLYTPTPASPPFDRSSSPTMFPSGSLIVTSRPTGTSYGSSLKRYPRAVSSLYASSTLST